MVGIDDDAGVCKLALIVSVDEVDQVLVVVVWNIVAMFIDCTTQDGVSQIVSGSVDFPATVNKGVGMLCSIYGI